MSYRTCSVEGCEHRHMARGWCGTHYDRWSKHGDPLVSLTPHRVNGTPEQRFFAKVSPPDRDGCVLWTASLNNEGYGQFNFNRKMQKAHRVAYILRFGEISPEVEIDHRCHTDDVACESSNECKHRRCVNTEHLELVSHRENVLRGRSPSAVNAAKTVCKWGHPFDAENTYINPNGGRDCKTCRRRHDRKRRSKLETATWYRWPFSLFSSVPIPLCH